MLQDVVKADAGHVGVETYIAETFESWASFRPQYMIGSGNNKDCEEWFFDRKFIQLEIECFEQFLLRTPVGLDPLTLCRYCSRKTCPNSWFWTAAD